MIKLFITDIDGCLTTPFSTPDWELISQIRRLNEQSSQDMAVPPLTICSGRPLSYVEAVTQWLGIDKPVGFESAGIYRLQNNNVRFLNAFDASAEEEIEQIKAWMEEEIIPMRNGIAPEFTKIMDAGLIHPDKAVIKEIYTPIDDYISEHHPRFEVHWTDVSINVVLSDNNKRNGIMALCDEMDMDLEETAYIGDSSGDIPALEVVGYPFAPQNASDEVKNCGAKVLDKSATAAVLSAYRSLIRTNRKELAAAE